MQKLSQALEIPASAGDGASVSLVDVFGSKWIGVTSIGTCVLRVMVSNDDGATWTQHGADIEADTLSFELAADVDAACIRRVSGTGTPIGSIRGWFASP